MDISFKLDPEVLIGADTLGMAGTIASRHGSRIMVVAESKLGAPVITRLKEILEDSGLEAIVYDRIDSSSSAEMADNIVQLTSASYCDAIIGLGGQNAQIIARMASILANPKLSSFDLLDGTISKETILQNGPLPFISIPTEGTYAFSFSNYFIAADPRHRVLKLIRSPNNLCSSVIIDSNLFTMLSDNTAGLFIMEGLFTALEAYCSSKANFFSDTILEKALTGFAKLIKTGASVVNADAFAQAVFLGSLGASASSPGIGTALSAAINVRTPISRTKCSAILFPAIAARLVSSRPEKMARLASLLGVPKAATTAETASAAVDVIRQNLANLNIPLNLKEHGVKIDRLVAACETARKLDFVANSPWPVAEEEVFNILKELF